MIIIAGAGHANREKYLIKEDKHCFHCNNSSKWILQKIKYFITLFFLPVVPYKTTFELFCPICGNSVKLEKETFNQMKRTAEPFK